MMPRSPRQLTFPLDPAVGFKAEDFLVAPANADAHAFLGAWPAWPARGVLLVGPPGSGKSHLASIWAGQAGATVLQAADLTLDAISRCPDDSAVIVENIDDAGASEDILFHFLNTAREKRAWALLTASCAPNLLWPKLPDLASRLRALVRLELASPDDGLVRAVLVKLFHDRQLVVDVEVIDYVARRMERSLGAAREIVAALDEEALALGRRVTKAVAAAVLARFEENEE